MKPKTPQSEAENQVEPVEIIPNSTRNKRELKLKSGRALLPRLPLRGASAAELEKELRQKYKDAYPDYPLHILQSIDSQLQQGKFGAQENVYHVFT